MLSYFFTYSLTYLLRDGIIHYWRLPETMIQIEKQFRGILNYNSKDEEKDGMINSVEGDRLTSQEEWVKNLTLIHCKDVVIVKFQKSS